MSRTSASSAAERLLAMIPWIAAQPGGVALEEVCTRFGISAERLESDLRALCLVGIAPHDPGMYVDVLLSDDWVHIRPQWFDRPPALSAEQGLALLAAAESLLAIEGSEPDGPLERALAKVQEAIGVEVGSDIGVDPGTADETVFKQVVEAVRDQTQLTISYFSHGVDRVGDRTIEPWRLFAAEGNWYTDAWCHNANALRMFRLDRIIGVIASGDSAKVERTEIAEPGPNLYKPGADDCVVTLAIDEGSHWAAERWNTVSQTTLPDGRLQVVMSVGSTAWLERILVQLGPRAEVTAISDPTAVDPAALARRILERYRS